MIESMETNELTVKDFVFALIGQDIEHFKTDIDDKAGYMGRLDVAQYIDKATNGGKPSLKKALAEDMESAFDEFFMFYTAVELAPFKCEVIEKFKTIPNPIELLNTNGKFIYYMDGLIYDNLTDEVFDTLKLRDERRKKLGVPLLNTLTFDEVAKSEYYENREIFRELQREYIRECSLFSYALSLLDLPQVRSQRNTPQPPTSVDDEGLNKLTPLLNGTSGKKTALIIKAALQMGMIGVKPSFSELKKRGVIGNPDGYNRYFRPNGTATILDDEVNNMINKISAL